MLPGPCGRPAGCQNRRRRSTGMFALHALAYLKLSGHHPHTRRSASCSRGSPRHPAGEHCHPHTAWVDYGKRIRQGDGLHDYPLAVMPEFAYQQPSNVTCQGLQGIRSWATPRPCSFEALAAPEPQQRRSHRSKRERRP